MNDTMKLIGQIAEKVGGEWKDAVLIDNYTNLENVDAYNEGVKAMAAQVCHYLNVIVTARGGEK